MKRTRALIAELALVVSGVFVFRGLWMLLDMLDFMHKPAVLGLSLLAGIVVTGWALQCLMKQDGE